MTCMLHAPAALHAAAGAEKLGRRRRWGHMFDGIEGGACRFIPGGIPVERQSPDALVVRQETWLRSQLLLADLRRRISKADDDV